MRSLCPLHTPRARKALSSKPLSPAQAFPKPWNVAAIDVLLDEKYEWPDHVVDCLIDSSMGVWRQDASTPKVNDALLEKLRRRTLVQMISRVNAMEFESGINQFAQRPGRNSFV